MNSHQTKVKESITPLIDKETYRRFYQLAESKFFQVFITATILLAAILVGVESYPAFHQEHALLFHLLDQTVLWIFTAEVFIKMASFGRRPWYYFRSPWNVFDFLLVAVSFLFMGAQMILLLRLARMLRVVRFLEVLPQLHILAAKLVKTIPLMSFVFGLLIIHFYIFAVVGTHFFGSNDPVHFGPPHTTFLTLFSAITFDNWSELMYTQIYGCNHFGYDQMSEMCIHPENYPFFAPFYFVVFLLIGAITVLNLFVGLMVNLMGELHKEAETSKIIRSRSEGGEELSLVEEINYVTVQIESLKSHLRLIGQKIHIDNVDKPKVEEKKKDTQRQENVYILNKEGVLEQSGSGRAGSVSITEQQEKKVLRSGNANEMDFEFFCIKQNEAVSERQYFLSCTLNGRKLLLLLETSKDSIVGHVRLGIKVAFKLLKQAPES